MEVLLATSTACGLVLHRARHRRMLKDLPRIPLAPGTLPVVGKVDIVKVRQCTCTHGSFGVGAHVSPWYVSTEWLGLCSLLCQNQTVASNASTSSSVWGTAQGDPS